jgi:glycosyltransferase involved in cell wall biosynthesis
VDAAWRKKILAQRQSPSSTRLNVLYLGRLDRQKGMDRLAEVIRKTRELDLPVDWRIVGSRVTGDFRIPSIVQEMVKPAVFDSQQLGALFAWADVMVLLSDYEGVPLSILEALRLGVVVIATNVGALSEIITTGRNGFLTDRESAVEQTLGLLRLLAEVPALRSKIAAAASHVAEWPEAAAELIDRMCNLVDTGRTSQSNLVPVETIAAQVVSPLRM